MNSLGFLIPIALGTGLLALLVFLWTVRSDQYDDLDGAAQRILLDEDTDPAKPKDPTQPGKGDDPA